jgi:hypothetical protein
MIFDIIIRGFTPAFPTVRRAADCAHSLRDKHVKQSIGFLFRHGAVINIRQYVAMKINDRH